MTKTLVAHLASTFSTAREPVATKSLAWILKDGTAGAALASFFAASTSGMSSTYTWTHQHVNEAGDKPDLVGRDAEGHARLVLEGKFDAGLTDAQPVDYLRAADLEATKARTTGAADAVALVAFVAPERRLAGLWRELVERTQREWPTASLAQSDLRVVVHPHLHLVAVGWEEVLGAVESGLAGNTAAAVHADLVQLRGLVQEFDRTTFVPFTSEELTGAQLAQHWAGLTEVITGAVEVARDEGASTKGLRNSASADEWGPYLSLGGVETLLCKSALLWRDHGQTPLWLYWHTATKPERAVIVRRALGERLIESDRGNLVLPLQLPVNGDLRTAKQAVGQQVIDVMKKLQAAQGALAQP